MNMFPNRVFLVSDMSHFDVFSFGRVEKSLFPQISSDCCNNSKLQLIESGRHRSVNFRFTFEKSAFMCVPKCAVLID